MTARRALRIACYPLVVGLLGWQVWRVRAGLADSLRTVGPTRVAVCMALTSVAWIPGFFSWRLVLAGLGTRLPVPVAYRMRFLAMLTNYLPGGVWPAVALAVQARQRGLPPARFAGSFVVGHALAVLAGLVVGLLALPVLVPGHPAWWLLVPVVAAG
ncbi:MAG TPA: hypothetical protein VMU51_27730, partial [Mycobacteriales bacterium]|nr:hypothetical protein [Mycobacteriales bacterium]